MKITDPIMAAKMEKALKCAGNLFDLNDIKNALQTGHMQGHVVGESWAITQIHDWPQRRSVNILFVIGNKEDLPELHAQVEEWAKNVGADMMTAYGREGWEEYLGSDTGKGWRKSNIVYSKDL
jgi:hypothetical protein